MINSKSLFCTLATLILLGGACKNNQLDDFGIQSTGSVKVSASPEVGEVVKDKSKVFVSLDVLLSIPASNAFEIDLKENQDTITTLIENGTLQNTIALPVGTYDAPAVVNVAYGEKKTTFKVAIATGVLEKNFGKQVAFAVKLSSPSKGNSVQQSKESFVVVLDTKKILTLEDIHYVTFKGGTAGIVNIPGGGEFGQNAEGLAIPLTLQLNGLGESVGFDATIEGSGSNIPAMVASGKLPANTIALAPENYRLDKVAKFLPGQNTAKFAITVYMPVIRDNVTKKLALTLTLTNVTKNLINPENKTITVVLDPVALLSADVTNAGQLSVSMDNPNGPGASQGSPKLVDGNYFNKFLAEMGSRLWAQLKYDQPIVINSYSITCAEDMHSRDAKIWNLSASNDGISWVILDERNTEVFENYNETKTFDFVNTKAFTYYRLNVLKNQGDYYFQMAEFRVFKKP